MQQCHDILLTAIILFIVQIHTAVHTCRTLNQRGGK